LRDVTKNQPLACAPISTGAQHQPQKGRFREKASNQLTLLQEMKPYSHGLPRPVVPKFAREQQEAGVNFAGGDGS
jgi:hypothetical protein